MFITSAGALGDMGDGARITRLVAAIEDLENRALLKLELGVIKIVFKPMIEATYLLEGAKACSLIAHDIILDNWRRLDEHTDTCTFPGMPAIIDECATSIKGLALPNYAAITKAQLVDTLKTKIVSMVEGSRTYYRKTFLGTLAPDLVVWKMCRYVNPIAMRYDAAMGVLGAAAGAQGRGGGAAGGGGGPYAGGGGGGQAAAAQAAAAGGGARAPGPGAGPSSLPEEFKESVRSLRRFSEEEIAQMEREWPDFVRRCSLMPVEEDDRDPTHVMDRAQVFWKHNRIFFPAIAKVARIAFILIPSSAAAERVFSMLKRHLTKQQMTSALEDYTQASCMLDWNHGLP